MTALADTALAFAREILGWEDAEFAPPEVNIICVFTSTPFGMRFEYSKLDSVACLVRHWCDEHEASFELSYYGHVPGEWEAEVSTPVSAEQAIDPNPRIALMTACLEASRNLKA